MTAEAAAGDQDNASTAGTQDKDAGVFSQHTYLKSLSVVPHCEGKKAWSSQQNGMQPS